MKRRYVFSIPFQIGLAFAASVAASGQTRQFLDAPVIKSDVPVQWNSSGKALQWLNGRGQPTEFATNTLFLSKGSVNVTYPRLNPLKIRATASTTAVADPAVATISKLIDAITTVVTTVAPPIPTPQNLANPMLKQQMMMAGNGSLAACDAQDSATTNLVILWNRLYTPVDPNETMGAKVAKWIGTIDTELNTGPGYLAVRDAADQIGNDAQAIATRITAINEAVARIHDCASNASATDRNLYIDADLSQSQNNSVVQQLTALKNTLTQLQTELQTGYAIDTSWVGANKKDFRINSTAILPTLELMQNVTVKVVSIDFKFDSTTGALAINNQDAGSVTFSVRRYSLLTPEIGTGAVFGTIKQPSYGTDKNAAGQTIVSRIPDSSISVSSSLMVNFVCHCSAGSLAPMLQMGTSVSKDLPALLIGGGLRLFGLGSGDISVSGGGMFAWVKDLQKLKPGDVINGTADINADLGYSSRPRTGAYFAILYKF